MTDQAPTSNTPQRRMFDIRSNRLNSAGHRVLEIELTALTTHLDDVRRVLKMKGDFELTFEASNGDIRKSGTIDPGTPRFQIVFEKGVDPNGAWLVVIEARDVERGKTRELWRQLVFVQMDRRIDNSCIAELAHKYAPVFVFSAKERYFPVSLQTLLAAPAIRESEDEMKLKTVFGKERIPLPELGDYMRFNGHCDTLLDFNIFSMKRSVFATLGGDPRDATIYYSYMEDPDSERFFITYHLLYAFDTKAGIARLTGIGPHVFDRESMVLVFDKPDRPSSMIISGHLEHQTIFLLHKLKIWTQGRIRVGYDDPGTLKLGDHPVIAVAEGSHALYPTSGTYTLSLLREIAGYLDEQLKILEFAEVDETDTSHIKPDQILLPPQVSSQQIAPYHLHSFGLDRLTSHIDADAGDYDGHNAYLTFSGYWVDVPGTQNARFPPFTKKVSEIDEWVDGAYEWDWDDLPEQYHRNNGIILNFLHENIEDF